MKQKLYDLWIRFLELIWLIDKTRHPIVPDEVLPPKAPDTPNDVVPPKLLQWWELPPEKQSIDWGGRPNVYPEHLQQEFIKRLHRFALDSGYSMKQAEDLIATGWGESGFNPYAIHKNIVGGVLSSTDWGGAQVNDYWHIIKYKDFPSVEWIMQHPEECYQWMAKIFKTAPNTWDAHKNGGYKNYLNGFNPYSKNFGAILIIPEKWL